MKHLIEKDIQKWHDMSKEYIEKTEKMETHSWRWGQVDSHAAMSQDHVLGNYKFIKDQYLIPNIKEKVVLEIGSYDGKWTEHMDVASQIICSDITANGFSAIKYNLGWEKINFHLCDGYSLSGINDRSVDFVFCIDTLGRTNARVIESYIHEIKRVLKDNGKACIHLPCDQKALSKSLEFTSLTHQQIVDFCHNAKISSFSIEEESINHGVLLLINIIDN
jgi:ubiquinone/menaquinone biosynthesis C-methylase UbiE